VYIVKVKVREENHKDIDNLRMLTNQTLELLGTADGGEIIFKYANGDQNLEQ